MHTSTVYMVVLFYSLFCLKVKVNPPVDSNSGEQSLLVNFIAIIVVRLYLSVAMKTFALPTFPSTVFGTVGIPMDNE